MRTYSLELELIDGGDTAVLLRIASVLHHRGASIRYLQFDSKDGVARITSRILARTSEPTLRESLRRIIGVLSVQVAADTGQQRGLGGGGGVDGSKRGGEGVAVVSGGVPQRRPDQVHVVPTA